MNKIVLIILLLFTMDAAAQTVDTIGTYGANGAHLEYMDATNKKVYVRSGTYSDFYCRNLIDIEFIPIGGVVRINAGYSYSAWSFENPGSHGAGGIRIKIRGDALLSQGIQYGFEVIAYQPATAGLNFNDSSRDISIYNVYVHGGLNNGGNNGQGIAIKTYPAGNYFKRGNGLNLGINRIINCKIVGTVNEGGYFGVSHYGNVPSRGFTPVADEVAMDSLIVRGCLFDSIGQSGMNVGGVTGGALIYDNTISNFALRYQYGHTGGVNLNPGSKPTIFNNRFIGKINHSIDLSAQATAIAYQGQGGKIYNNLFKGIFTPVTFLRNTDQACSNSLPDVYWVNNTIDSCGISIWAFAYNFDAGKIHVWNNACSSDSVNYRMDGNNWTGMDTLTNKFGTTSFMQFINPGLNNYAITSTSPLKGAGTNKSTLFTTDATNQPRPALWSIGSLEEGIAPDTRIRLWRQ